MAHRKIRFIPGGLRQGAQIIVRGRVPENSERFAINLQNNQEEGSDIALHFNPRFYNQSVVRNSFQDGSWQEEETEMTCFPFVAGGSFTVRIHVAEDFYNILINNFYNVRFNHRIPFHDVRYLVLQEGAEFYESTIQNPSRVPYQIEFSNQFRVGTSVRVRGLVNDDAERFHINFSADADNDTVALHFNPRQNQDQVVLNSKQGGWQEEQLESENYPFQRGQLFDVFFVALQDRFNIYVNEYFFTSFYYRMSIDDIRFLCVEGDVTLMDVRPETPLSDDFIEEVPSGLEKGDRVVVKGFFNPEGERFSINFMYGTSTDDDIGLHFNPRRDQGEVVFNNREGGDWQTEERHELPWAFREQIPFEVEIVTKEKKFKVFVNGRKLAKFRARGAVSDIRGINVAGDAYFYDVHVLKTVPDPFICTIPATLEPGSWMQVVGTPRKEADRFAIDFQREYDTEYQSDVALHFNPRFGEEQCVRNSLEGGSWCSEEREQPEFPFQRKERFELNVVRLNEVFRVFVNGHHYADFVHRIDPAAVQYIVLRGDCKFFEPEFF